MRGLERTALLRFYMGQGVDQAGRTWADVISFSDEELEGEHNYIQWLFPTPEPSRFNPRAPLLSEHDVSRFKKEPLLVAHALEALERFREFLEGTSGWVVPGNHNQLRISRILRFLTVIGQGDEAKKFYDGAVEMLGSNSVVSERTLMYWGEAMGKQRWYEEKDAIRQSLLRQRDAMVSVVSDVMPKKDYEFQAVTNPDAREIVTLNWVLSLL